MIGGLRQTGSHMGGVLIERVLQTAGEFEASGILHTGQSRAKPLLNPESLIKYALSPVLPSIIIYRPAMDWRDYIETKPEVLAGKPVVTGTRIPVELVVELLAQDWAMEEILEQYPALSREDIQACLHYASERLKSERVYPVKRAPET